MTVPDPAIAATGILRTFNELGVLEWSDVHTARWTMYLCQESDERVALAMALAVRALRHGSVCFELEQASTADYELQETAIRVPPELWPETSAWIGALEMSPAVAVGDQAHTDRPLRWVSGLLYLERYWREEVSVTERLRARREAPPFFVRADLVTPLVQELFPLPPGVNADDLEALPRLAAATTVYSPVTVIAGGPGTGKTTTIARILALLLGVSDRPLRIALAAPTGKAAARLAEAVNGQLHDLPADAAARLADLQSTTVHRLLGPLPDTRSRFKHGASNPLPHDVVVVDEVSMVSLTLMSRLLSAMHPTSRLVLVGDPHQLASVDAGTVLADLTSGFAVANPALDTVLAPVVGPIAADQDRHGVIELTVNWRFGGAIADFASAIKDGQATVAADILASGAPGLNFLDPRSGRDRARRVLVDAGREQYEAATLGDERRALAALDSHRLLSAHRFGPFGVGHWQAATLAWLNQVMPGFADDEWFPGRPLLVTRNTPEFGLFNGDTGVVVMKDGAPRAAFPRGDDVRLLPPALLDSVDTVFAMTVHKAQGSQFDSVTLILPPVESPLLTRELLYTAVTRAKRDVTVIGTPEAVRRAVERPARRSSRVQSALERLNG